MKVVKNTTRRRDTGLHVVERKPRPSISGRSYIPAAGHDRSAEVQAHSGTFDNAADPDIPRHGGAYGGATDWR